MVRAQFAHICTMSITDTDTPGWTKRKLIKKNTSGCNIPQDGMYANRVTMRSWGPERTPTWSAMIVSPILVGDLMERGPRALMRRPTMLRATMSAKKNSGSGTPHTNATTM